MYDPTTSTSLHIIMQGSCERQVVICVFYDAIEKCDEKMGPLLATGVH